jgi:AraC-like DNA-binding protein
MTDLEIRRLSELRSLLESFAARRAAENAAAQPERLQTMRAALPQILSAIRRRDYPTFRAADYALHDAIVTMADVPLLRELWHTVWTGLQDFHRKGCEECFPDARVLAEEHEHLVDTIALGDPAAAEDAARHHVEAVWYRIAERDGAATAQHADPLQRACAHLAFRMHCPLRLTEVAKKIAFTSPGNLSRLFRQHHGLSFQTYLQKIRLDKAAELLRSTQMPVARIARRVGYRDLSRFGLHFKRRFGAPPARWRQR